MCDKGMVDTVLLLAGRTAMFIPAEVHRTDVSVLATLETVAGKLQFEYSLHKGLQPFSKISSNTILFLKFGQMCILITSPSIMERGKNQE